MDADGEYPVSIPSIVDGELFFKLNSCSVNKLRAICIKCNKIISSPGNSSNFVTHLKRVHQDQLARYEIYKANIRTQKYRKRKCVENISQQDIKPIPEFSQNTFEFIKSQHQLQEELDENIVNYFVGSMKPLSTVEDLGFKKIIQGINSELEVMSIPTLITKIKEKCETVKEEITVALKNAPYVCTTADMWSTKHSSFLGSTAHYIDKDNFQRKSVVLACTRFKETHSFDKMALALYDINESYSLRGSKLVSTVTDNGSNFIDAFKTLGVATRLPNSSALTDDGHDSDEEEELNFSALSESLHHPSLPTQVPCGSHILSLVATTDFSNALKECPSISSLHYATMEKCSALWNANRRLKASEIIVEILQSSLTMPCPTRWISLYAAVTQLLQHKAKLNEVLQKLDIPLLKDCELDYLDQYCTVMKPIAIALEKLQNENECYYGMYIPIIISVHQQLQQLLNLNPNLNQINPVIVKLIEAYEQRFKDFLDLSSNVNCAIIASCSHPHFKMRWVPSHKKQTVHSLMVCAMEDVHTPIEDNNEQTDSSSGDEFFSFNTDTDSKYQDKSLSEVELELSSYLNIREKDLKILNNFPILKKVFLQYNTTICSSGPVERLFSFTEFINAPSRRYMSDENFKMLVFLKGNSNRKL